MWFSKFVTSKHVNTTRPEERLPNLPTSNDHNVQMSPGWAPDVRRSGLFLLLCFMEGFRWIFSPDRSGFVPSCVDQQKTSLSNTGVVSKLKVKKGSIPVISGSNWYDLIDPVAMFLSEPLLEIWSQSAMWIYLDHSEHLRTKSSSIMCFFSHQQWHRQYLSLWFFLRFLLFPVFACGVCFLG